MSTSAVPDLIDALIAQAPAALEPLSFDVDVIDGPGVDGGELTDFLMVGVNDPDSNDQATSADATQDWQNAGNLGARKEEGTITCAALSWNGDADQKRARDHVFAIAGAVSDMCRTTPDLGVPTLLWTSFGGNSDLFQNQDETGAVALLVFRIGFRALI